MLQKAKFNSFLWLSNIAPCMYVCICVCVCVCIYISHIFFIHSFIDGHFGCFQILVIVNSASVNTVVHVSLHISVFVLGIYPAAGWLDHSRSSLNLLKNHHTVSYSLLGFRYPSLILTGKNRKESYFIY